MTQLTTLTAARSLDRAWRIPRFTTLWEHDGRRLAGVPLVKITGTNGKGSVAAMLEAALRASGYRVGLFTSPHLERLTERIRIDRRELGEQELSNLLVKIEAVVAHFVRERGTLYVPSFFEALLLLGLRAFEEAGVDFAIIEAGVGGAHDPTSILPGFLSILTTVGFDHEAELGGSLAEIAAEKAGIAGEGTRLVLGPLIAGEALAAVEKQALPRGVRITRAERGRLRVLSRDLTGTRVAIAHGGGELEVGVPLLGDFQIDNLAVAVSALDAIEGHGFQVGREGLAGIADTRWSARLEYCPGSPSWLLDGAHNEEAMDALVTAVRLYFPDRERLLVYGTTCRKSYGRYLHRLAEIAPEVYLTDDFDDSQDRLVLEQELADRVEIRGSWGCLPDLLTLLEKQEKADRKLVVVAGSLYLVGKVREWLTTRGRTGHE